MEDLQLLFAKLKQDSVPVAALMACGYYENRNSATGRTRG
jgi:hypothetical protein